ncbi:MAG: DinB family protein [Bacteroidota bacterium]
MTVDDLKVLYNYSHWANEKLFDVIAQLPEEAFSREVAGSFGSIRNTMVHILSAEWGWMSRCGGPARPNKLTPDAFLTLQSLRDTFDEVRHHMQTFLDTLQEEDLARIISYPGNAGAIRSMPLGELMQHTANHAVHHRGQVMLMIRMLGHSPGHADMLFYFAEEHGTIAW